MKSYLKLYLEDFVDDLFWFLFNPSFKNLKNVLTYLDPNKYRKYKIEMIYWKDKDVKYLRADNF